MIKGKCEKCNSNKLYLYEGLLGYEAVKCKDCNNHHTANKKNF